MAVEKRTLKDGSVAYRARLRGPDGRERTKQFPRKKDAVDWLATQRSSLRGGNWVDPRGGNVTFADWVEAWRPAQVHLRVTSAERDDSIIRNHLLTRWGRVSLARIEPQHVGGWVGDLVASGLKPRTVHKIVQTFSKIVDAAVAARKIALNPAKGVRLPAVVKNDPMALTAAQVDALADAIVGYRAWVYVAAYCGLRFGELAGLRWGRVNLLRRELDVVEQAVELNDGSVLFSAPKTTKGTRKVPIPRFVCEELARCTNPNPDPDALVFTGGHGGVMRGSAFRKRVWRPACEAVGLPDLVPHSLRHFSISMWISAGGNPVEVARRAGHSSVRTVLDVYADVDLGEADTLTEALDAHRSARSATDRR